jgi:DNA polymerase I-like protein with 3'-5' exonuclease and polymerase domains
VLIGADYSAVEARLTAWFADERWLLDVYKRYDTGDGLDPYCMTASKILGRPVTPAQDADRQIGKMCTLAFGFGGGAGAFNRIAPDAGFSESEIESFKRQWRAAHPKIVKFWGDFASILTARRAVAYARDVQEPEGGNARRQSVFAPAERSRNRLSGSANPAGPVRQ